MKRQATTPQGNEAVDLLAIAMNASKLYHGHTHDSLDYGKASAAAGFAIHGVGLCGITSIDGTQIVRGEQDDARAYRKVVPT